MPISRLALLFLSVLSFSSPAQERNSAPWVGVTLTGLACPSGGSGTNYYDYTNKADRKRLLGVVEAHHFTQSVELHIAGQSGTIPDDLNYTIKTFPNHHKALLSAIRYQRKLNYKLLPKNIPLKVPVECYLQRAIHFSPNDVASISLYAYYLKEVRQLEKAAKLYQKALEIEPDNPKIEYSYSLLLIELEQNDKALEYAQKAYTHGKPPEELKTKLIKLGVWKQAADR